MGVESGRSAAPAAESVRRVAEEAGGVATGEEDGAPAGSRFVAAPGVMVTDLGEDVVLLDTASGEMYALDAVGRRVWHALGGGVAAAADALVDAFHVAPERARSDVRALVGDLLRAGLVAPAGEDG